MPPFDFPNTPTVGQQVTNGSAVYEWDGVKWVGVGGSGGGGGGAFLPLTGGTLSNPGGANASQLLTLQAAAGVENKIGFNGTRNWSEGTTVSGWWFVRDETAGINRLSMTADGEFSVNSVGSNGTMEIIAPGSTSAGVAAPHLQLNQAANAGGPNGVQIQMNGGNRSWIEGVTPSGWWYVRDHTAGINRLSITDTGYFSVQASGSPSMELIDASTGGVTLNLWAGATAAPGSFGWQIGIRGQSEANPGRFYIWELTAGIYGLFIQPDGSCFNQTGTWSSISDSRVKQNVQPYLQGLDAIRQLNPIAFQYNGSAETQAGFRSYGLDADAVARVMPELVGKLKTKMNKDDTTGTEVSTVDNGRLVFALVNAIKELAAKVDDLQNRRA